jgi:hypothetical protein
VNQDHLGVDHRRPKTGELEEREGIMGDSAPRKQPLNAEGTGEAWEEADAEPDPQAESGQPAKEDLANDKDPRSKFHG